jgi:hypothetical protein
MSFTASVVAAIASFFSFFSKLLDWFKNKEAVNHGKNLKEVEIIKQNDEVEKEQTNVLIQDRTKDEVIEKMEKGTF